MCQDWSQCKSGLANGPLLGHFCWVCKGQVLRSIAALEPCVDPTYSWCPSLPCSLPHPLQVLEEFGVPLELTVVSAHRTPERMMEYAKTAHKRGLQVIIAGAGENWGAKGGGAGGGGEGAEDGGGMRVRTWHVGQVLFCGLQVIIAGAGESGWGREGDGGKGHVVDAIAWPADYHRRGRWEPGGREEGRAMDFRAMHLERML